MRISLDDVLSMQQKGTPVLNPMQKGGLCEVCRHRAPSMIPPALDLRSEQSVRQFLRWYMKQDKVGISHENLNRARLCALVLNELDTANKYLLEWILAKARICLDKFKKLGGNPVEFEEQSKQKLFPLIKEKWPELSEEDVEYNANEIIDETVCKLLGIERSDYGYEIDTLNAEWYVISNDKALPELAAKEYIDYDKAVKAIDLTCIEADILRRGIWNAYDLFVPMLHSLIKSRAGSDEVDSMMGWYEYEWFIDEYVPDERDNTIGPDEVDKVEKVEKGDEHDVSAEVSKALVDLFNKIAVQAVDSVPETVLVARLFSQMRYISYEKSLALRAAANATERYIRSQDTTDRLNTNSQNYLSEYGIVPQTQVDEFLLGQVLYIAEVYLDFVPNDEIGDPRIRKSLEKLLVAVRSKRELAKHADNFSALIDVMRSCEELLKAKSRGEEDAILADFESAVLQIPEDPIQAVLYYLPSRTGTTTVAYESDHNLHSILEACTAQSLSTTPRDIFILHPRYRELGMKAGARALAHGVSEELRRRIYDHWPELSVPHITKTLEGLKGLGHDFSLTVFQRLIQSQHYEREIVLDSGPNFRSVRVETVFSDHNVRMVDIGERLATLERAMRAKLRDLFSDSPEVLKSSELWSEQKHKIILERYDSFRTNMNARGVKSHDLNLADFADFGDLAHVIKSRLAREDGKTDGKPYFKKTEHQHQELNAAMSRVRAFRNAWAHHAPIESGFEKFEESYNFVFDWVNSLEKFEQ